MTFLVLPKYQERQQFYNNRENMGLIVLIIPYLHYLYRGCNEIAVPKRNKRRKKRVEANGSSDEARLVAFLAFMKADILLFEYMVEVYSAKFYMRYEEISDSEFLCFIDSKAQNSEIVAKWSTGNLKNIRVKIKNTLCEAGLAKRTKGGLLIRQPLLRETICSLLDEDDHIYARAMLLEGI